MENTNPEITPEATDPRVELVNQFIGATGTKRFFCGKDGAKIKELNEAIEYVKAKNEGNTELLAKIDEAEKREPSLEEKYSSLKDMQAELEADRANLDAMSNNRDYPEGKLKSDKMAYNDKVRKYQQMKANLLDALKAQKEAATQENEQAKGKNEAARELHGEFQDKLSKEGSIKDEK